jgi:CrcB protein
MRRLAPVPCRDIVSNLTLQSIVLVMLGSGLGGGARLWLSTLVARSTSLAFPWGTLFVNVSGCLLVGVLGALLAPPGRLHDAQQIRVFLVTGVLGGFTTFSAFALETVLLYERGQVLAAAAYVLSSTVACILAATVTYVAVGAALR